MSEEEILAIALKITEIRMGSSGSKQPIEKHVSKFLEKYNSIKPVVQQMLSKPISVGNFSSPIVVNTEQPNRYPGRDQVF